MKAYMKVTDLSEAVLDWAVAKCEGIVFSVHSNDIGFKQVYREYHPHLWEDYIPSRNWGQGGPIIEREGITLERGNDLIFPKGNEFGEYSEPLWLAFYKPHRKFHGSNPLEAAMRCYVASKLGEDIDIPKELS